ncbi:methyl-accepting chemotaxis protein [Psychromonas sp. 14N.309.X.WAT.B.A12]|uniref:methyl-accepting chemotaxis protein n=1 Tax=Psychromonas sp. 14N.309.X.WAT.B.A12 TaxID=2998322 RepID=UPI0025B0640F|nr:methyl-accepting chemotaxis protein [Psychromonas sp. 14N.309.X.WAT.B.A12]MDN2662317.1 methyl-accepting chemotaxis protein [Psychromonas sp. 14N.309.X.WAT.B.A12]
MLRSLKVQIYLLVFIPFVIMAGLGLYSEIRSTTVIEDKVSEMTLNNTLAIEKKRLKTVVDSAYSMIQDYIQLPGDSGLKEALSVIDKLRYDNGTGYIFTYDLKGVRLQSGSGKGIGKNFYNNQDKKGNYITQNVISAAKDGTGYSTYYFVKPGATEPSPKYSYSLLVPKWNIVISTGFYIDDVEKAQKEVDAAIVEVATEAINDAIFLFLIAFIIVAVAVFIAINKLYLPLNNLSVSVNGLAAGEGDLTATLPASYISLLDKLAADFNKFLAAMGLDIKNLKGTSEELNNIASQSSQQQARLEALSNQQKEETVQVAAAIDQMSSTSNEIANTAEQTRASATAVETEIRGVLQQVEVSNEQLEDLNSLMKGVEGSINELGDNVTLIHSVLSVIQGISEQTNLLALNAAIEAARAGEQGRGFAVVADEVRNLAKRSQDSTVEIKGILDKLQDSAEKTVQDMARSDEQRQVVTDAMAKIREFIHSSNQGIQQLSEMNVQVATAASEQSTVSSEIAERINGIASLAEDIGNSSTEARSQFASLELQSKLIAEMTNKFTV